MIENTGTPDNPRCQHGERRFLWGVNRHNGKLWTGWGCALVKDDPQRCDILFSNHPEPWNEIADRNGLPNCDHGQRRNVVSGLGRKGRWAGYMCGGEKGLPQDEKCQPLWINAARTHHGSWERALTERVAANLAKGEA